jgi:hypothetical protein
MIQPFLSQWCCSSVPGTAQPECRVAACEQREPAVVFGADPGAGAAGQPMTLVNR